MADDMMEMMLYTLYVMADDMKEMMLFMYIYEWYEGDDVA
jgi:hypothetical protein